MKSKILVFLFIAVLLVLSIQQVMALGITPGRTSIDYQQGLEQDVSFSVINNEHKNMQVLLMVQGELNNSITLFDSVISFNPSDESKSFKYKIKLSDGIAKEPGVHTAEIVALEIPKASESGSFVGATVAVVSQIYVYVPCPGKCIDADLNILDAEENSTATFIVPVINRGKLGIGDAKAIIDIYTSANEKLDSVETDSAKVDSGSRTELSGKWNVGVRSGNYIARVSVFYDGETKIFEKQFSVGSQMLTIESMFVNDFRLGEIAKLRILVENNWNQELKQVYANLFVYNKESQVMADVKSSSEDVPALSKKELIAYWDTVGVSEGEYNGKLMVVYGKKSTDKNLLLKISENNLDIIGVGYAIKPGAGGKGVNITTILVIVVILMLVVNLAWFVFFRRMIGQNKQAKQKSEVIRLGKPKK